LGLIVFLSPGSPLWAVAAAVALVVELTLWLYAYECRAVTPRRARWLVGLRLGAMAMLLWIWLAPTWVRTVVNDPMREVVVVLDESASMKLKDDGETLTRLEIGKKALADSKLIETLESQLRVRTIQVARTVRDDQGQVGEDWNQATDLAAALDTVLKQVSPDKLGGVVLVSDGRHNRPTRVEDVARRYGILDARVGVIEAGSAVPPTDAVLVSVRAPEALHLGDRMRVDAEVRFDGYKDKNATVKLLRGQDVLEERVISIPHEHHRETLRFTQTPEAGGMGDYRVEITPLPGERFADNNGWNFETSITDARVNVLLVDNNPRWEFRYLRNLFYGRDKSVQLQYVLQNPDRIKGQNDPAVAASASRPFGDAQATRLPESEQEWRKFDVIILGDVEARTIDEKTWDIISRCVKERAALLVLIAGPESMPHAIESATGRALVPVEMEWGAQKYVASDGKGFRLALTTEGLNHPLTQQSDGQMANEQVWARFPELHWRHPMVKLKDGAEVLLKAQDDPAADEIRGEDGFEANLARLASRRAREAVAAVLVTRQTGYGKVALLLTDRTWRLREGAGDVFHHRFWGNMIRWGAGPVLRAGGQRVRLGTDRLTYTPDEPVKIMVRMRDAALNPLSDETLRAEILRDGKVMATLPLGALDGSNGFQEIAAGPFKEPGNYEVRVKGQRVEEWIAEDGTGPLSVTFRVTGANSPIEMTETTLNRPLLQTIANLSNGRVVKPDAADELASLFVRDRRELEEVRETSLWDRWLVIGLLAGLLTAEWVVRRGGGLP
jgi:hypothetical protein